MQNADERLTDLHTTLTLRRDDVRMLFGGS
jgi:hypothetical protein